MENEHTTIRSVNEAFVNPKEVALQAIAFVRDQLPAWRDDPHRNFEQAESKLNSQLCDFLTSHVRNLLPMVCFKHEELQPGRRSVDMSVKLVENTVLEARAYSIYDPILVFECKRLPAPSSDREKEYVTGGKERKTGGIQRFKLGLHGADLDLVVMIGYLQSRSACEWHHDVNEWILELCRGKATDGCGWNDNEILEPLEQNVTTGIANYRSIHDRTDSRSGNDVEIRHLWITMHMQHQ